MTREQQATLDKCRAIDARFWKRWPEEKVRIRRPFPGEIDAMAAMPNSTQFKLYNPAATYMIASGRAIVNGEAGFVTLAEVVSEPVPPDGIRGIPAELMFANMLTRQGIDTTKKVDLRGRQGT